MEALYLLAIGAVAQGGSISISCHAVSKVGGLGLRYLSIHTVNGVGNTAAHAASSERHYVEFDSRI